MPLTELRARAETLRTDLRAIIASAEAESRDLTPDEAARFDPLEVELRTLTETTIPAAEAEETAATERRARIAAVRAAGSTGGTGGPVATIGAEPMVYGRNSGNSYFLDLARATLGRGADPAAASQRLNRHAQELDVELPKRAAARRALADRECRAEFGEAASPFEKRINPNRVDGQGGYFVPPLWLIDEYIAALRNGRPFADTVHQMALPDGTDSINIPKINSGTVVGAQPADAGPVSSVDLTDTFVTAPVRTYAGQQDVAMQLLDQSPIAFDEVVFSDLGADYAFRIGTDVFQGTGTGGRVLGIDNVSGVNAITYTQASPTGGTFYAVAAQALSQVARIRKLPGSHLVMHGVRWFWLASQLDSQNRPLVVPTDIPAFNAMGLNPPPNEAQGIVGRMLGVPVLADMNIVGGDGVTQDRLYAVRADDLYLFEGTPRVRALQEVLSGTLQVRFQLYNYIAFLPNRYPQAISVVTGTGLAAPSGF